jgi:hypothetical protein
MKDGRLSLGVKVPESRLGDWQEWQTLCPGLDVEGHFML